MKPTFTISKDKCSITCLKCGRTSHNLNDVKHRYCGHCHVFHEARTCSCCGEPFTHESFGGPNICPSCDIGKCRYCGVPIMVLREEIDGGRSKRALLDHMAWHKRNKIVEESC